MHENDDLVEPDLDTLTRGELAELDGPAHTVAGVLDDWLHRLHGITSGQHGAGLFLDLLAAEGWRVERIQVPELSSLLPAPSGPQQITDPAFPDLVGVVGGPLIPCKVTEITATTAPTERVEATGDLDAHYEHTQRYVIRYQPATWPRDQLMPAFVWGDKGWWYRQALTEYWDAHDLTPKPHAAPDEVQRAVDWWNQRAGGEPGAPVHISYMAGASGEQIERAKRAVIGTVVEMASEMHARFACPGWQYATTEGPRKQWPDAGSPPAGEGWERNTDAGRDGWERLDYSERSFWRRPVPERERLVHENPALAAQIREGITEAERGDTVDLGSFAQYLDESDDDD